MLTVESITDAQIRELRNELLSESRNQFTLDTDATGMALYDLDRCPPNLREDARILKVIARERCCEIINARSKR